MTLSHVGLVTAVITTFNDEGRLGHLVTEARRLSREGVTVLLMDDASTDGTHDRLTAALEGEPGVLCLRRMVNGGVAQARSAALAQVSTPFVLFLDPDDEWPAGAVASLVRGATSDDVDVVIGSARIVEHRFLGARVVDETAVTRRMSGAEAQREMLHGRIHGYLWNKLFRVSQAPSSFPGLSSQSDFPFTYAAVRAARVVVQIPDEVYVHVLRSDSLSQSRSRAANLERCRSMVCDSGDVDQHDLWLFESWFVLDAMGRLLLRDGHRALSDLESIRQTARGVHLRHLRAVARQGQYALMFRLVVLACGRAAPRSYVRLGTALTRASHARRSWRRRRG